MNKNNKDKVYKIIKEVFPLVDGEIKNEWGPDQIEEWDSLGHLNLVMVIGEKFNVSLEFTEVMSIEKVGDIINILNEKGIE